RKIRKLGMTLLGYRKVPTINDDLGEGSLSVEPWVEQIFIKRPEILRDSLDFERKLYIFRQSVSRLINESVKGAKDLFYFTTVSSRTKVYKGQLTTGQLRYYFPDLENEQVVSALAVVHSRFSTNTFPSWKLAQPFRYIAHNGEINTVKGNVNWIRAGEQSFSSPYFSKEELDMVLPICDMDQSDSANLDNAIELLYLSGRSLPHVMMMLIPEAWDGNEQMSPERKAFYEYHAAIMEPWDGPASISFTDGKIVGATLDRRSEEHTSELQSRENLVCRLLLESLARSLALHSFPTRRSSELSGRSLPHVMMMLIPEAWDGNEQMSPERKAFYEYHAAIMEPWDGPASISFTDGKIVGATLDR